MVQILFTVFGMGHIYENAQIIHNHGTLLHTTVLTVGCLVVATGISGRSSVGKRAFVDLFLLKAI